MFCLLANVGGERVGALVLFVGLEAGGFGCCPFCLVDGGEEGIGLGGGVMYVCQVEAVGVCKAFCVDGLAAHDEYFCVCFAGFEGLGEAMEDFYAGNAEFLLARENYVTSVGQCSLGE